MLSQRKHKSIPLLLQTESRVVSALRLELNFKLCDHLPLLFLSLFLVGLVNKFRLYPTQVIEFLLELPLRVEAVILCQASHKNASIYI